MRFLIPKGEPVNFDGVDRTFLFNINVIDNIQDHFDQSIAEVLENIYTKDPIAVKKCYDTLAYVIVALCNEDTRKYNKENKDKREMVTLEYVKERVTYALAQWLGVIVQKCYLEACCEKQSEDKPDPNAKSE